MDVYLFFSPLTLALGTSNRQEGQKKHEISMETQASQRIASHSSQKRREER